jgi:hypothetical protein
VTVPTWGGSWKVVWGSGTASGNLTLAIPPVSSLVAVSTSTVPAKAGTPVLKAAPDALTDYFALTATVPGAPASVWFAVRRPGGAWQKVAADDSAPYRGFVDPVKFKKKQKVQAVAVARSVDGSVAVSKVVTFTPHD